MKVLVVYDSVYGNTEQIARAIGGAITEDVKVIHVRETEPAELLGIDLLIVGAPTQGGRPTTEMQNFLKKASPSDIQDLKIVTFDTRISARWVGIFGYAAGRIAKSLKKKGGILIKDPEPFFVAGTQGPLKEGELERAATWAQEVINSLK